ncbi:MAG: hypothetical protein LBM04_08780, partial [Opitutaceae bacterium]|nr:hypothetical protein [Opitutaceae bacterium]
NQSGKNDPRSDVSQPSVATPQSAAYPRAATIPAVAESASGVASSDKRATTPKQSHAPHTPHTPYALRLLQSSQSSAFQAPGENASAMLASASAASSTAENATPDDALSTKTRVTLDKIPAGRFREDVLALAPAARTRVFRALTANPVPEADYDSLRAMPGGLLYYVCKLSPAIAAMPEPPAAPHATPDDDDAEPAAANVPINQPPVRHSRPGSRNVLFLDFGGGDITGTAWNTMTDEGQVSRYRTKPYNTAGDETTFTDQEQRNIIEIWEHVAEDFAPFDVDVTTEKPAAFTRTTARALITHSRDTNGTDMPAVKDGAAGVALRDFFGDAEFATKYSPVFIYYDKLLSNNARIAYAVSHELGHNLGLSHDGPGTTLDTTGEDYGYYDGHGSGAISWAPIMGAGYGNSVIQWSKGEYRNANNHEDDLAIIEAKLGYRPGIAPATMADATALVPLPNGVLGATGILRHAGDAHYYAINLGSSGTINFTLSPARLSTTGTIVGNTDLVLEIHNASTGVLSGSDNPSLATTASLSRLLSADRWYVRVSSTGAGNPLSTPPTGYTAYGSIGQYTLSTDLVYSHPTLAAALDSDLTWTNEPGSATEWFGQHVNTHDGIDAAQSGPIDQGQSTGIVTTVEGSGTVSFWWKIAAGANDELVFATTVAGGTTSIRDTISGATGWSQRTFPITTIGTHQFGWTFDRAPVSGNPAPSVTGSAWVDQVVWMPAAPFVFNITPSTREIFPHAGQFTIAIEATKTWTATTDASSDAPWLTLTPASGSGNTTLTVTHEANDTGRTRRGAITITSAGINRVCEVTQPPSPPTLATALDNNLAWQTGGAGTWAGQTVITHDGLHAARSGITFGDQESWLQTTVNGPGVLNFWWKVFSEEEESDDSEAWGDILHFYVDGKERLRTSGEKDWVPRSFFISGSGAHTLRWAYEKDPYFAAGADAAWLDQVTWTTGTATTLNISPDSRRVASIRGEFAITVDTAASWNATSSASWLSVSPSTGSGAGTITAAYAANTTKTARTGTITVKAGDLTDTCVVTQAATTLSISPDSMQVTATSGRFAIAVDTTVSWNATSSASWLSVSPSTGSGAGTINAAYAANTATTTRTGTITVTSGGNTDTCVVTQAATTTSGTSGNNNSSGGGGGGALGLWSLATIALLCALRKTLR